MDPRRAARARALILALVLLALTACRGGAKTVERPAADTTPEPAAVAAEATPAPVDDVESMSPEARVYLVTALNHIEGNAVRADRVDWESARRRAYAEARGAQTPAATYGAIRGVIRALGDNHSGFFEPEAARQLTAGAAQGYGLLIVAPELIVVEVFEGGAAERAGVRVGDQLVAINGAPPPPRPEARDAYPIPPAPGTRVGLKRPGESQTVELTLDPGQFSTAGTPRGRRLAGEIGYLDLPGTLGPSPQYAPTAQNLIREIDQTPACGWVVDLRRDTGGNMWPMIAGVGPIVGEGELGAFVSATNKTPWSYRDGRSISGATPVVVVPAPYALKRPAPPVAVLTSRLTASSGELTLLAFLGRPETRTFGEPSAGVPTANSGRQLSDGAVINLTTALGADRTGTTYDAKIPPDEPVAIDWRALGSPEDPVLRAALAWLRSRPACAG
jgi:carboxyl-terminal processing protease